MKWTLCFQKLFFPQDMDITGIGAQGLYDKGSGFGTLLCDSHGQTVKDNRQKIGVAAGSCSVADLLCDAGFVSI